MEELLISLTDKNARKLLKHKPVQLKASQIGTGVKVHPDMPMRHKKALMKAMKLKKGVRLQFSPEELIQGSGFFDWLYNNIAKPFVNVAKSAYRPLAEVARPLVRQYAPEIAKAASTYTGVPISTEQVLGAEKLSKDILGVGMKRMKGGALKTNKTRGVRDMSGIQDNYSTLISPQHPIFQTNQQMPAQDMYGAMQQMRGSGMVLKTAPQDYFSFTPLLNKPDYTSGGSFLPAGYKSKRGGKIIPKVGGSFKVSGY
jgi:hypothetical protein